VLSGAAIFYQHSITRDETCCRPAAQVSQPQPPLYSSVTSAVQGLLSSGFVWWHTVRPLPLFSIRKTHHDITITVALSTDTSGSAATVAAVFLSDQLIAVDCIHLLALV